MDNAIVEMMGQPVKLIRQTGNLCLLYSVLNALRSDEDRCKFLQSQDPADLRKFLEFIQNFDHQKNNEPGFPSGIMCKDINWYLRHLKQIGVVKWYKMKNVRLDLPKLLRIDRRNNRESAFLICGHTTTNPDIRKKIVKYCSGKNAFVDWKRFRDKMKNGSAKISKSDYSTHAVAMRFTADNRPVLLDPGRRVSVVLTEKNFGSEISKSIFDYYSVCKFSLEFA